MKNLKYQLKAIATILKMILKVNQTMKLLMKQATMKLLKRASQLKLNTRVLKMLNSNLLLNHLIID
jgi:hypothetical protein